MSSNLWRTCMCASLYIYILMSQIFFRISLKNFWQVVPYCDSFNSIQLVQTFPISFFIFIRNKETSYISFKALNIGDGNNKIRASLWCF